MTVNIDKLDDLSPLVGYFHQDWVFEFDTWEQAVDAFLDAWSSLPEDINKVISTLNKLINANLSETELDVIFSNLDCNYQPGDNESHREWLQKVLSRIQQRQADTVGHVKKDHSRNGIPGNTSDDRLRQPEIAPRSQLSPWGYLNIPPFFDMGSPVPASQSGNRRQEGWAISRLDNRPRHNRSSGPSLRVVIYVMVFIFLAISVESRDMQGLLYRIFGH